MRQLLLRVWYLIRWRRLEADLAEQLEFHRVMKQRELEERGLERREASLATRRALGNVTLAREDARAVWIWPWLESVWKDGVFALRQMRRQPGFATVAIVVLAVGIGANTVMFSVVDAMLLQPLPYSDSDRLVALRSSNPAQDFPDDKAALLDLVDWQTQAQSFEVIAGYRWMTLDLTGGERSERLHGLWVTPEFFEVFGVRALVGRTLIREDSRIPAILLGHDVWRRRFDEDPQLVGKMLDVNVRNFSRVGATPYLVVGVATSGVRFPPLTADFQLGLSSIDDQIDFWAIESIEGWSRGGREFDVVGKLRPGVTVTQAQVEMDAIARRLAESFPVWNAGWGVRVIPLRDHVLGGTRRAVFLLSLCTGMVLLIACGNVASLLLARGMARQREVLIRAALGAGRLRIIRQFLVEVTLMS